MLGGGRIVSGVSGLGGGDGRSASADQFEAGSGAGDLDHVGVVARVTDGKTGRSGGARLDRLDQRSELEVSGILGQVRQARLVRIGHDDLVGLGDGDVLVHRGSGRKLTVSALGGGDGGASRAKDLQHRSVHFHHRISAGHGVGDGQVGTCGGGHVGVRRSEGQAGQVLRPGDGLSLQGIVNDGQVLRDRGGRVVDRVSALTGGDLDRAPRNQGGDVTGDAGHRGIAAGKGDTQSGTRGGAQGVGACAEVLVGQRTEGQRLGRLAHRQGLLDGGSGVEARVSVLRCPNRGHARTQNVNRTRTGHGGDVRTGDHFEGHRKSRTGAGVQVEVRR